MSVFYKKRVDVVCPHCNFDNALILGEGRHFVFCDHEEGGCEECFAIEVKFRVEYKVFTLVDVTI